MNYSTLTKRAQSVSGRVTCNRMHCESQKVSPYPGIILKDYNDRTPSCERYKWLHPRKMYDSHICMCDNNVLNLSNRRNVTPDGRTAMSIFDSPTKNTLRRLRSPDKNDSITPKVGQINFKYEAVAESPPSKGYIREQLLDKFRDFYETQSPVLLRQRKSSQNNITSPAKTPINMETPSRNPRMEQSFKTFCTAKDYISMSESKEKLSTGPSRRTIKVKVTEDSIEEADNGSPDYRKEQSVSKEKDREIFRQAVMSQVWLHDYYNEKRKTNLIKIKKTDKEQKTWQERDLELKKRKEELRKQLEEVKAITSTTRITRSTEKSTYSCKAKSGREKLAEELKEAIKRKMARPVERSVVQYPKRLVMDLYGTKS